MQSGDQTNTATSDAASTGMNADDVLFTLFRHKWLIVAFICLGAAGACMVRVMRPPLFVSQAKLNVPYIKESAPTAGPAGADAFRQTSSGAQSVINTEVEILRSLDVASNAAVKVGPAKILAKRGGGDDLMSAAGAVCSGTEVELPQHTTILTVAFRHPDPSIVQPVLNALIEMYMQKSVVVHEKTEILDEYYRQRKQDLQKQLETTQETLRGLKLRAGGTLVVDDSKHSLQTQIDKLSNQLQDAERELAERRAVMGGTNNNAAVDVTPDVIEKYTTLMADVTSLKQGEREALRLGYKDAHPTLMRIHEQLDARNRSRAALIREHPSLASLPLGGAEGTNSA